ncbi:MAG: DUF975 family protein [Eubacterium sp.]
MNNINRVLVKSQAKQLIREKVFILFVISFVAVFLTNGISFSLNYDDVFDSFENRIESYSGAVDADENDFDDYLEQYYNNGSNGSSGNPIEDFGKTYGNSSNSNGSNNSSSTKPFFKNLDRYEIGVPSIVGFILSPLLVSLAGFYVYFIKKDPNEELRLGAELKGLFKHSFDGSYIKKLVIYILRALLTTVLSFLLFIPGIIFYYSSYFAYQLMCDYPNLKPSEAIKLSKKIIKGNRSELFWLDLSFIPWYLLCAITFGIAGVYVMPYYLTVKALYYENFRLRAIAEGRVNDDDFLSADELIIKYNTQSSFNGYDGYSQNNTDYQSSNGNTYYQPPQDFAQDTANNNDTAGQNGEYYYSPPQPESTDAPQQDNYYHNDGEHTNE